MIIMRTVGGDLCKAELQVGLVLKTHDRPTPEALGGYGHRLFAIVHASDEERELLRHHGIRLEEVSFNNMEIHQRRLPEESARPRGSRRRNVKTKANVKAAAQATATTAPTPIELRRAA